MQQCMTYSSRSPPLMGKRGHNNVDSPGPLTGSGYRSIVRGDGNSPSRLHS